MSGQFFKSLVRRAVLALSSSKPRRRRPVFRNSLERLESRALLSAVGYDAPNIPAEVRLITQESSAPPTSGGAASGDAARRTRPTQLFAGGTITLDTPFGPIDLNGRQHGSRIRGTANLSGIDLAQAGQLAGVLGIDIPPFLSLITLPTVKFKGTFQNGQVNATFNTTLKVPLIGDVELAGQITGGVNLALGQLNGHLKATANGSTILDQDFTATLPALPAPLNQLPIPRISNVAGVHQFQSNSLGNGSITITQNGQDINGTFNSTGLTSGAFAAHFKTARSLQAKGTVEFLFVGEEVPETDQFFISFFRDGDFKRFRYS